MASPEQQAANQANAQHSTGPNTDAGKARSALNARTHGLCSKDILIGAEEKEEFDKMAIGYYIELNPEGPTEQTLFDETVGAAWQLRRMRRMETEACAGHDSYTAILDDEVLQKKLDRLARHKTRIERTFHRCLKEFKTIQNARYEEDKSFHSMQSLIAERMAQQNSERTQSEPEPPASEPLAPDYFDKINAEFEEIDRGLAELGCYATPPKPEVV
jgi:hypothetical protein